MAIERKQWHHYADVLEHLKTYFPSPVSDPIMDGYFVHSISRFLDQVDSLKSAKPLLGNGIKNSHYEASQQAVFPEAISSIEDMIGLLADYCQGMTIWSHPNAQLNVIPPPTIPSITAFVAAAIYNPNIITDEYAGRFSEAEIESIAMLSNLVGYDPQQAGGLFTFGGTGTILYGCKLGIEKILGGRGMQEGIREDFKIFSSDVSHYSRLNVAGWLGLGTKNLIAVASTSNNEMSLSALEDALRAALSRGEKVAVIIATLGTTDAFGIDDLAAIVHLRDNLVDEYGLDYIPHVHADAVIGWAWSVFRDYNFEDNPLGFHARTLRSLTDSLERIDSLQMADSIGIDLHKTGYAPYISSVILIKDRSSLALLSREPEQMPYLYQGGHYHPGIYTLECSRSGAGALAALASMTLLGKQGYRVLIGHNIEMAEMLRERLERHDCIQVLNDYNYGPVTLFRVYPPGVDAEKALHCELNDPDYRSQLMEHNQYNRQIFDLICERVMQGEGVLLSWTLAYRYANYPNGPAVAALKSFIMSPWTDLKAIDAVVNQVMEVREQLSGS
ncbi:pyridoxal-dependent decarboxylase [Methylobacter sp. S3L5C]|uniref:pyridoxal phosphate-dependent decarboxylase family protein n=1 Tax=Methylobacter sp. S3L5C TaxID=2839024 RepID=UPI001FAD382F|nr:pyridoxal-dependent decarboxylase [Methylobacter sp. S3L5C]UOA08959.1 aspartate aminotransferase family protein [Methylobacter sp. S3L5C]